MWGACHRPRTSGVGVEIVSDPARRTIIIMQQVIRPPGSSPLNFRATVRATRTSVTHAHERSEDEQRPGRPDPQFPTKIVAGLVPAGIRVSSTKTARCGGQSSYRRNSLLWGKGTAVSVSEYPSTEQRFAGGTSMAAAIIMVTVGIIQFFQGIAAVAENEVFVVGVDYVYKFDLTTWGWIHLVLGALVAIVGLALFTGASWARVSAIIVAAVSILANFLWLPYYPVWSLVIIALDVVVIWAVSTWSPERV